jgi:hypothetical protein
MTNRSKILAAFFKDLQRGRIGHQRDQHNDTSGSNLTYTLAAQPNSTYYVSVQGGWGTAGENTLTLGTTFQRWASTAPPPIIVGAAGSAYPAGMAAMVEDQ